ncbi:hypothetical protein NYR97_19115 [Xanthomonas hydrangeae]|uniref:Uncharacterized protein n=1 Tax=Xanthomonas hydrangeae TaxID=2775159 RepID=A0AAU0BBH9_9XANT|nr:hypothetical protein [Xanthomonas hydrangeae]WOB49296.1 hypothetical protein NYR97_19115 [Xanthomonas hydrangeae]
MLPNSGATPLTSHRWLLYAKLPVTKRTGYFRSKDGKAAYTVPSQPLLPMTTHHASNGMHIASVLGHFDTRRLPA